MCHISIKYRFLLRKIILAIFQYKCKRHFQQDFPCDILVLFTKILVYSLVIIPSTFRFALSNIINNRVTDFLLWFSKSNSQLHIQQIFCYLEIPCIR